MAFLIPLVVAVFFILAIDRAVDRLEADTYDLPSFDTRNRPLLRTDCQYGSMSLFSSRASNMTATWRTLFTRILKSSRQEKSASISSMQSVETQNR